MSAESEKAVRGLLAPNKYVYAREYAMYSDDKSIPFRMRAALKNKWNRQLKREVMEDIKKEI